jgi:hypothetical protein
VKPTDALYQAIIAGFVSSRRLEPGVVVSSLPKEQRDALAQLTSDDSLAMRTDLFTYAGVKR